MGAACGRAAEPSASVEDDTDEEVDSESDDAFAARSHAAATPSAAPCGPAPRASDEAGRAVLSSDGAASAQDAAATPAAAPERAPRDSAGRVTAPEAPKLRWLRGEMLGTGAFGRVFLGLNEDTGELLAVKEVLLSGNTMQKAAEHLAGLEQEVALLRGCGRVRAACACGVCALTPPACTACRTRTSCVTLARSARRRRVRPARPRRCMALRLPTFHVQIVDASPLPAPLSATRAARTCAGASHLP